MKTKLGTIPIMENIKLSEATGSERFLTGTNLLLVGSGLDVYGNRIVRLAYPNNRSFSIQTLGNLPISYTALKGLVTTKDMDKIPTEDIDKMSKEISNYISKYGTKNQKDNLKIY
jgi:hypothetical protein